MVVKVFQVLLLAVLLGGCVSAPEPISVARKDVFRAAKKLVYLPVVITGGSAVAVGWEPRVNVGGNFAISGAYFNGKSYLGGYGNGKLYSYPPLALELDNTGEAVLGVVAFNNLVYAASENNDMQGQQTRVFKRNGAWSTVGIEGYAAFFVTVWNNQLVVTSTRNLASIDINISADGVNFGRMATLNDWLWIPTVYKGELYVLGHDGGPDSSGGSKAVKWNGNNFVPVPSLCNVPGVSEWQSATEHNGQMYVGAGGWTVARGSSLATVFRFDGLNSVAVKNDPNFHEVQALLSSRGNLYASFGHGFKSDEGGSKIWALRGDTWIESGSFPGCPQLYALVETPQGYIAAGGSQGNLKVYDVAIAPKKKEGL